MKDDKPETGQRRNAPGNPAPLWVKVFAAAALALLVIFAVVHLLGLNPAHHSFVTGSNQMRGTLSS
jgi:hypothetical protein